MASVSARLGCAASAGWKTCKKPKVRLWASCRVLWASCVALCLRIISISNLLSSRCTDRTMRAAHTTSPLSAGPRSFISPSMISTMSSEPLPLESMMSKSLAWSVTEISKSSRICVTLGSPMTSSNISRDTPICMVSVSSSVTMLTSLSMASAGCPRKRIHHRRTENLRGLSAFFVVGNRPSNGLEYLRDPDRVRRVQIRSTMLRSSWATRISSLRRAWCRFCWLTLAASSVFSTKIAMTRLNTPKSTKHVTRRYPMVNNAPSASIKCGANGTPSEALQSPMRQRKTVNIERKTVENSRE
mmetsp:Transcript_39431/g.91454  ORF Transcript_39431/g.91454 Transcript_39431/m.91454 type:complete len:300 (-) Transcript_39431:1488-2387(-)